MAVLIAFALAFCPVTPKIARERGLETRTTHAFSRGGGAFSFFFSLLIVETPAAAWRVSLSAGSLAMAPGGGGGDGGGESGKGGGNAEEARRGRSATRAVSASFAVSRKSRAVSPSSASNARSTARSAAKTRDRRSSEASVVSSPSSRTRRVISRRNTERAVSVTASMSVFSRLLENVSFSSSVSFFLCSEKVPVSAGDSAFFFF